MSTFPSLAAVVPCAGSGERMVGSGAGAGESKLFIELPSGRPVLAEAMLALLESEYCQSLTLAIREQDREPIQNLVETFCKSASVHLVSGGATRQESVLRAIESLGKDPDFILVHDGARPMCPKVDIDQVCQKAFATGAAILACPATSTVKLTEGENVESTIDRSKVWLAQTPQVFSIEILLDSLEKASKAQYSGTDESSLVEFAGYPVAIVRGSSTNIKLTDAGDLELLKGLYAKTK